MKFDSKVKGGLAWAGLFVILAVPSADLLFGKEAEPAANLAVTSDTALVKDSTEVRPVVPAARPVLKVDPVETASIDAPAANSDDPVGTYLNKGKKLPAYISDADSAPVVKPAAVTQPVEVAAIAPVQETPPVPLPRSARPVVTAPVVAVAPTEQPLIIDETDLAQREATLNQPTQPMEPFPLSDGDQVATDDTVVTGDQLEEWDSGSLADYLAAKGLLSEDSMQPLSAEDDSDFVFNDGPSRPRRPQSDFFLF